MTRSYYRLALCLAATCAAASLSACNGATAPPVSPGTVVVAPAPVAARPSTAAVEKVAARYQAAKLAADVVLMMVAPQLLPQVHAITGRIDGYLAGARAAATIADQARLLDAAKAEIALLEGR